MKEIAKYSYLMIAALVISSLLNYLYQVVMGNMLPKHEFGVLGVALSIFYIAGVLTQNTFSWTGTRRMASQINESLKVFRTTLLGNFTLAMIATLIIFYYSRGSKVYMIPNALIAATVIVSALVNSYVSLLRAMKFFKPIAGMNVAVSALRFLFAVILVSIGFGATGAIAALFISIVAVLAYLMLKASEIELPKAKGLVWDMIPETFYISAIFLSVSFMINSSIIFTRFFSGSDVLAGDYNAALTIARGPFFVTGALVTVLFPYVSSNKREEFAFQSIKYIVLLVLPLSVSMFVDPDTWLNLFFGKKYMGGAEVLRFLSIGIGLISLSFIISSNLVAFEKVKIPAVFLVLASAIQALIAFTDSNPVTASISVVAASIVSASLLLAYYVRYFYFKGSLDYMLKIMVSYAMLSAMFVLIHANGRLSSLVEICLSFAIYFVVLSVLNVFDERDVDTILSPLPENIHRLIRQIVVKLNSLGKII